MRSDFLFQMNYVKEVFLCRTLRKSACRESIASACVPVITVMLNKVEKDYSMADELCDHDELSKFTRDEIKNAVSELNGRKFLLKVDKPYGCVYAVNKLLMANMEFVYGR